MIEPRPPIDILWVFAHPDDEAFGSAGTMLLAHDAGMSTALICATRGEAGEIRDPLLGTSAILGAVRELELRRAMRLVHLSDLRLLEYRDSGMTGTPPNADPRALINAPHETAVAHIVGHIRDLRPRAVVTFGPDGVYGHPDHIRIGAITDDAVRVAASDTLPGLGTPWRIEAMYLAASPREQLLRSRSHPESPFAAMPEDEVARMGTPAGEITHWIDVRSKLGAKHDVLMQHRTQISRDNPLTDVASESVSAMLGRETYRQVVLPWNDGPPEHDPVSVLQVRFAANRAIAEFSLRNG